MKKPELYFPRDVEWREWLHANHRNFPQGVHLIFYKLEVNIASMRWEEAVRVALCYGWIDSTVKGLGDGKRKQYFCPRSPKSTWSALNKKHIDELELQALIHASGRKMIDLAKSSGTWTAMDNVENLVVPVDLQTAFNSNSKALDNYQNFASGYRKSYLSWLHSAKRDATRSKRIAAIIDLCARGEKSR